jgi:hypothetical protein
MMAAVVDPVLSPGAYLLGVAWLAIVGGSTVAAAATVRRMWLVALPRTSAGVAMAVLGLTQITLAAELLAAVGLLRPLPLLAAVVLSSGVIVTVARRAAPPASTTVKEGLPSPPAERWAATLAVAAAGAQWVAHTADALSRGMTHADTVWYHAPYSARFLQMGSLGDLGTLGYGQSRFFPLGSELLHTVVALPFHRDLLSPIVNLAFAGLALAAAAAIGARWGAAALSVLATAMLLGLPTLAGTQPGQASNDVVAAALVLSAVGLYLHAEHRPIPMGLAGAALGLAAGTKVTVLALVGPLAAGILVVALRDAHRRAAAWWVVGAVVPALCWPLRNIALVGTPLPWIEIHLGPLRHAAIAPPSGAPTLVRSLLDSSPWSYTVALNRGFGPLWPVVLGVALGGVVALVRGPRQLRVVAASAVIGAVAYAFTPFTGGSSFQFNLRYLTPSLFLSIVVLVVTCAQARWARSTAAAALACVTVANLLADHHERVAAWPGGAATAVASLIGIAALASWVGARAAPSTTPVFLTLAALAAVTGGWFVQERYLEQRYVAADLHDDPLNATFRTVSGRTVDVLGTPEVYPMFGADLSNEVHDRSTLLYLDAPMPADPCRHWRGLLARSDYVVISSFGYVLRRFSPQDRQAFFEADPAVTEVYGEPERAIYRVDGSLDPATC